MKRERSLTKGFTLIEIMIVVAIIGLLAAIAIPSYVHARTNSQTNACIYNLRQIDNAKQNWALENRVDPTATPTDVIIQPYMGRGLAGSLPWCPADTNTTFASSYNINNIQVPPTCNVSPGTHVYN
jgi:prepilin-type N-terminal cleavage/methylation domain-containing protein